MSDVVYELVKINDYAIPPIDKGRVVVAPNPKYNSYDGEGGNKIIEPIRNDQLKGSVEYVGAFQSNIARMMEEINLVSTMTVYNPFTGSPRTFTALILVGDSSKIIYDAQANAWTFTFTFEEIDDVE